MYIYFKEAKQLDEQGKAHKTQAMNIQERICVPHFPLLLLCCLFCFFMLLALNWFAVYVPFHLLFLHCFHFVISIPINLCGVWSYIADIGEHNDRGVLNQAGRKSSYDSLYEFASCVWLVFVHHLGEMIPMVQVEFGTLRSILDLSLIHIWRCRRS